MSCQIILRSKLNSQSHQEVALISLLPPLSDLSQDPAHPKRFVPLGKLASLALHDQDCVA